MVGGAVWEFMNNADRSSFLESELVGLGVWVPVGQSSRPPKWNSAH